jgi:hypothetical protein
MDCKAWNIYCARLYAKTTTPLLLRTMIIVLVMLRLTPDGFQRLISNRLGYMNMLAFTERAFTD